MYQQANRGETFVLFIAVTLVLGLILGVTIYMFTQRTVSNENVELQKEAVTLESTINILPLLYNQGTYTVTYEPQEAFDYCINTASCPRKVLVAGKQSRRSYTFSDTEKNPLIYEKENHVIITNQA